MQDEADAACFILHPVSCIKHPFHSSSAVLCASVVRCSFYFCATPFASGSHTTRKPTLNTFWYGRYGNRKAERALSGRSQKEPPRTTFGPSGSGLSRPSAESYG